GIVLATCWASLGTLHGGRQVWAALCLIGSIIAASIYAQGLSLLPAVTIARAVAMGRIDRLSIAMGTIAGGMIVLYVLRGGGLSQPMSAINFGDRAGESSILPSFFKTAMIWVQLTGTSLCIPLSSHASRLFTTVLGASVIVVQIVFLVLFLRTNRAEREIYL